MNDEEHSGIVLVTENLAGNLHQAAETINKLDLAEFVVAMHYSGSATVVVYRMSASVRDLLKEEGALR